MNRRTALKQFFVLAGGIWIASSCDFSAEAPSIALKQIKLTKADEELLAELLETIIPKTDSPGAKDLKLHLFVMKMVDDCESPENQEAFLKGLKAVPKPQNNPQTELMSYLEGLPKDDVFLRILKRRGIQGYKNSEYVMKNKLIYELVPGRYDGAFKIKA
ncbi:gluconate 2-dehydrogenase subunit 3 family protein [Sphingobacterium sp. 1.A.4]|uniref:gluconate 2-dehydrogenase subunit 3 family protein n=1 Tax=Sphingobacterium sp. 1.A.4 TaxID=2044603 RepID=UPI000C0BF7D2|nr:gluconate 2-dehydrogenase subunit 3 family protein [Sphingobacterium sp. 1.A.4]